MKQPVEVYNLLSLARRTAVSGVSEFLARRLKLQQAEFLPSRDHSFAQCGVLPAIDQYSRVRTARIRERPID